MKRVSTECFTEIATISCFSFSSCAVRNASSRSATRARAQRWPSAASGASRGSRRSSNFFPSAQRPEIFTAPPPYSKNAAEARPAKRSGSRSGAAPETSPETRRPVTSGVPISRPTACSASSSRAPGSTSVLVPPPSAASLRRKPEFTAVSMPTVKTRAPPSSAWMCFKTPDSSPTWPSVSSTTTGTRPSEECSRICASASAMARSSWVPPRAKISRSHFSPCSMPPSSAWVKPPGIHSALSSKAWTANRSRGASVRKSTAQARVAEAIFGPCIEPERSTTKMTSRGAPR